MHIAARFAIFLACVFTLPLFGQDALERAHMADPASALYQRSAFAHGYLHGYEMGFHLADIDIQFGHMLPGVKVRRDAHGLDPQYRPAFGDKDLFFNGYKMGMRAGYADSISGHEFRAISELRAAADGIASAGRSQNFDKGFSDGYQAGEHYGANAHQQLTSFESVDHSCRQSKPNSSDSPYCDAYTRGFQLGYADGRAEQQDGATAVQTAENQTRP